VPRAVLATYSTWATWATLVSILVLFAACAPFLIPETEPEPPLAARFHLRAASFTELPGWGVDQQGDALKAFHRSCDKMLRRAAAAGLGGVIPGNAGAWYGVCKAASVGDTRDHQAARLFFEDWFQPYAVLNNGREMGLFTGYFEPELRGSLTPGDGYDIALYRRPDDLVTVSLGRFREAMAGERIAGRVVNGALLPYPTRAEIEAGALVGQLLELVWVDSAVDAFFLHIQGSGRVRLKGGGARRVAYAASNGQPYIAIGRSLVERGTLAWEEVTMQSIRAWLEANPAEASAVMQENNSFVFFRWLDGKATELGPIGAQGVPLLAGRSLAVDRKFLPLGAPLWLEAAAPDGNPSLPDQMLRRLMVAQDTGSAIRGPVRGDVFWGTGRDAGEIAGRMKHRGRYWLLLPRDLDVQALVN